MTTAAITMEDVAVQFAGLRVIDGVNLHVRPGELRILIGPNGAGKTTLVDIISGRTRCDRGRILIHGRDVTRLDEYLVARQGVGRKFQIPSVFRGLTVRQNLEVALRSGAGVLANIVPAASRHRADRLIEILDLVGLNAAAKTRAEHLSHGETQWLELGILMAQDPRVLLLDEPTAGMTQNETRRTADIVNHLKGRHTIVIVEHDMAFVRAVAETVSVLHLGKIIAEGDIRTIESDPLVRQAYLGPSGVGAC